jgi:tyrosyl-tRNA synthetase
MGYFDVDIRSRRNDPSSKKLFAAAIRTDKLLVQAGLASSATEAGRKRKERAVKINGELVTAAQIAKFIPGELVVGVGRKLKKVKITL